MSVGPLSLQIVIAHGDHRESVSISLSPMEAAQLTMESLEQFVHERCTETHSKSCKLSIAWKDEGERDTPIRSDEELRQAIDTQMEISCELRFFVAAKRKRAFPDSDEVDEEEYCCNAESLTKEAESQGVSPFYFACDAGDLRGVQALLRQARKRMENENENVKPFMQNIIQQLVNEEQKGKV